jgi:hypothetical protein
MGTAGLEKVQAHSLENVVQRYETLYDAIRLGAPLDGFQA